MRGDGERVGWIIVAGCVVFFVLLVGVILLLSYGAD